MLKVLDRYPLSLPVKNGFTPALYDTVIITSNKPPHEWYRKGLGALARRIQYACYTECDKPVEFTQAPYVSGVPLEPYCEKVECDTGF